MSKNNSKPKALVFAPFQGLPTHRFPEALLVKKLNELGYEIDYLTCDRLFQKLCIVHRAYGLNENSPDTSRIKICELCNQFRDRMNKILGQAGINPLNINEYVNEVEVENWWTETGDLTALGIPDLEIEGCPIGRFASYEFILNKKISDVTKISDHEFKVFLTALKHSFNTMSAIKNVFSKNKYDFVLLYNHAYSVNNVVRHFAQANNTPTCSIHSGYNLKRVHQSLVATWKTNFVFARDMVFDYMDSPPKEATHLENYQQIIEHFEELLTARSVHVYSLPRASSTQDVKDRLGIKNSDGKIALLAMSSEDEAYGALFSFGQPEDFQKMRKVFPDQVTWIGKTIEFFRKHPEHQLIVRVHPREYPNKRESVVSTKVKEYDKLFENLPDNVLINKPEDEISLYDLFELIDFNLVAHTSVGLEAALLGIPAVGIVKGYGLYPTSMILDTPDTEDGYYESISRLLESEETRSLDILMEALKWQSWFYSNGTFNFDSQYFQKRNNFMSKVRRRLVKYFGSPLGLAPYHIDQYLKETHVNPKESQVISEFFDKRFELHKSRLSSRQFSQTDESTILHSYIDELLGLFYKSKHISKDQKLGQFLMNQTNTAGKTNHAPHQ